MVRFNGSTNAVPSAFPAVRHIDLSQPGGADSLFAPKNGSLTVDHWQHLKSLTVRGIDGIPDFLDGLAIWLKMRQIMDIPKPLVRFSFLNPTQDDHVTSPCYGVGGTISALHGALHELCSLEWVNVPLEGVVLSGTLDESLRLVCALPVTSHRSVVVDLDSVIY